MKHRIENSNDANIFLGIYNDIIFKNDDTKKFDLILTKGRKKVMRPLIYRLVLVRSYFKTALNNILKY